MGVDEGNIQVILDVEMIMENCSVNSGSAPPPPPPSTLFVRRKKKKNHVTHLHA